MSSQDVMRSVSKKLKYYFEVKRLEDGFDLTGPDCPKLDHPPLRARPTLMYDGLHDRPLKHYFNQPDVRVTLTKLSVSEGKAGRQKKVKKKMEQKMRQYTFLSPSLMDSYYNYNRQGDQRRLKSSAHPGHGTGLKRSKMPHRGGYPVLRSSAPSYITRGETNRLVNTAAKLLVATEIVDLKNGSKRRMSHSSSHTADSRSSGQGSRKQSAPKPFETNRSVPNEDEESSDAENEDNKKQQKRRTQSAHDHQGDKRQNKEGRGKEPGQDSAYSTPMHSASPNAYSSNEDSNSDYSYSDDDTGTSSDESEQSNQKHDKEPHPPTSARGERPGSAKYQHRLKPLTQQGGGNTESYRRCDSPSTSSSRTTSARSAGSGRDSGTQTGGELLNDYNPSDTVLKEGEEVCYRVHVFTGNKLGASTNAEVQLALIGDQGRTENCILANSKHAIIKFQKGQEDVFDQEFIHVGRLKKISIGHDRKELGYGWYLDKVIIKDMRDHTRYTIPCETWLSSKHGDGSTVKEFAVKAAVSYNTETDRESAQPQKYVAQTTPRILPVRIGGTPPESERGGNSNNNAQVSPSHTAGTYDGTNDAYRHSSGSSYDSSTDSSSDSNSSDTEEEQDKKKPQPEPVAIPTPRTPQPISRKDDFFDQRVVDKDFTNVIETLSHGTEQDNKEDFESDRVVYSSRKSQPAKSPIPEQDEKLQDSDSETAHLSRKDVQTDSEDDQAKPVVHRISYNEDKSMAGESSERNGAAARPNTNIRRSSITSTSSSSTSSGSSYTSSSRSTSPEPDNPANATIHQAATSGDLEQVKKLVQQNPHLKLAPDEHSWQPLHLAANSGQEEVIQWLCVNIIDLDAQTPTGYTAMHLAALHGHTPCMMLLAAMGAMVDCPSMEKRTPLHLAALSGHTDTVRWILSNNKVNKHSKDMTDRTPLDLAQSNGHTDIIRLLAGHDSDDHGEEKQWGSVTGDHQGAASTATHAGSSVMSNGDEVEHRDKFKEKHDEELMEKRQAYDEQHKRMSEGHTSFLDSIRAEYDDEFQ